MEVVNGEEEMEEEVFQTTQGYLASTVLRHAVY